MSRKSVPHTVAACAGGVTREPELVLVFGKVLTLAGFPPWLLRNSEIV